MKDLGNDEPKVYRIRLYDPVAEEFDEDFFVGMDVVDAMEHAAKLYDDLFDREPLGVTMVISAELVSDYKSTLFFTRAAKEYLIKMWAYSWATKTEST